MLRRTLLLLFVATTAIAAVLNFDDINIPTSPAGCGSKKLNGVPYHGFSITGATPASDAYALNTTQDQWCHGSSGGHGPFSIYQSKPNVLFGANGGITISSTQRFKVTGLYLMTRIPIRPPLPNPHVNVKIRGYTLSGDFYKGDEYDVDLLARGPGPWEFSPLWGFETLGRLEIKLEYRYTQDGSDVAEPAPAYADTIWYKFQANP